MSIVAEGVEPPRHAEDAEARALRPGARAANVSASFGRTATVSATVLAVLALDNPTSAVIPATLVAVAIWIVAFHGVHAAGAAWVSLIGSPVASVLGAAVGLGGVAAAFTLIPGFEAPEPLHLVVLGASVAAALAVYETLTHRRFARPKRVLIVGTHNGRDDLALDLRGRGHVPLTIVGVADMNEDRGEACDDLRAMIERERPDLIVLGDVPDYGRVIHCLFESAAIPFRVLDVRHFYEHAFGRVPLDDLTPTWFMGILHLYRRPYSRITKRSFDLVLASIGLVLAAPLILVGVVLVRCSGRGPVFFRQVRLGEGGRPFEIYKLRTMVANAERDGVAVWATKFDPRVTPVGRLLRRTRLDELPQLWNVVRGDMSIVGPRPERPEFLELLSGEVPFWMRRHLVKPGITGWAQIRGGYTSDPLGAAEKLSYDLYYLKHRSLLLDLAITARTAAVMITGAGAH